MKKINILLGLLLILAIMPMALAEDEISAITITAPSSTGSYVGGTYTFTATYTGNSSGNVTFSYNGTTLCADTTVTETDGTASCEFDTSGIADGTQPTFIATAYNSTGDSTAVSTTWNIIFDNTEPVISLFETNSLLLETSDALSYTVTATDTQDTSLTYSVVLTKPMNLGTVTRTTSTGSYSNADTGEAGVYTITATVTDDAGNTDTATLQATIDESGNVQNVETIQQKADNTNVIIFGGVMIVIILVAVIMMVTNQPTKRKGKRRRRR